MSNRPSAQDQECSTAREAAVAAIAEALHRDKSLWGKQDARTAVRVLLSEPDLLRALTDYPACEAMETTG